MRRILAVLPALVVGACAVAPPSGPSVMALPPQGKDFAAFQQEDAMCRYYASDAAGGERNAQAASDA